MTRNLVCWDSLTQLRSMKQGVVLLIRPHPHKENKERRVGVVIGVGLLKALPACSRRLHHRSKFCAFTTFIYIPSHELFPTYSDFQSWIADKAQEKWPKAILQQMCHRDGVKQPRFHRLPPGGSRLPAAGIRWACHLELSTF